MKKYLVIILALFHIPMALSAVSKEEFLKAISLVEKTYSHDVERVGKKLIIDGIWSDETPNLYMRITKDKVIVSVLGGFAKVSEMTTDSLILGICHELGHFAAGAPIRGRGATYFSITAQSDYFAAAKCLKRILHEKNGPIRRVPIDPYVTKKCYQAYGEGDLHSITICERIAKAGLAIASFFTRIRRETSSPNFRTPDPHIVPQTLNIHPSVQCRLDTYLAGALCTEDFLSPTSTIDPHQGYCHRSAGDILGVRPLCWYRPQIN